MISILDVNCIFLYACVIANENKQPTEKVKKIKEEYERKLTDMQREMKSLQSAKKEHAKLLRSQTQYESQIRTLSNEVGDMKKTKVGNVFKLAGNTSTYCLFPNSL